MSKKNKSKKSKNHQADNGRQNSKEVRAIRQKIGKVHLVILFIMVIAALLFVLPKIS